MTDKPIPRRTRRAAAHGVPSGVAAVLHEGERIIQMAIIHPGIYWKAVAVFMFAVFLLLTVFNLGIFFLLVAAIMTAFAWLTKHYLLLVLTDKRVILRYGILNLETVQMHYNRIESVELAWTPMGRILGYSTILITGTGSRVTGVPFLANGQTVRAAMDDLIQAQEDKPLKVEQVN